MKDAKNRITRLVDMALEIRVNTGAIAASIRKEMNAVIKELEHEESEVDRGCYNCEYQYCGSPCDKCNGCSDWELDSDIANQKERSEK